MSKSWGRIVVPKASIDGVVGGVPLGRLDRNNSHVVSVLGAIPVEVSAWQACHIQSLSGKGNGSNNTLSCTALPRMAISIGVA